ncbi:UbiA family prenyltransferase [Nocardioides dongxiaopingii]|uniref:UbiA family prenyltransferase n=1 Tax=Nocardioides dongxiaopingii TaxID=2576036 RepID=UPI0010C769E5|nr:UbiA family prenyltransferase [Nocardioides dongxiaopingii]
MTRAPVLPSLVAAAHGGPALAVTVVAALLGVAADLPASSVAMVTAAVLAGQLTIGWGNDLVDTRRDQDVGRSDKPLATGALSPRLVLGCLVGAAVACVVLSVAVGGRSALVHLGLVVAMGHAYNLGLKATAWSWLPYALAFGSLPAVVSLAEGRWPGWWLLATGALLGVGAHLLNALPDLADDVRTGVRGLPHRLGATGSRVLAAGLLTLGSVLAVVGPGGEPPLWAWLVLVLVGGLAVASVLGRGRLPFQAAMAIALVDVVLLVAR